MAVDPRPGVLPPAVLDAISGASAQLNEAGEILGVNATWRALADRAELLPSTNVTTGANYLTSCEQAASAGVAAGLEAAAAVRRVLDGGASAATLVYEVPREPEAKRFELVVTRLDGNGFHGALITQVDVTNDVSERKQLEAQLVQAQKMETLGRLAGGIAHDFNNLLTVMIGYAELLHASEGMPPLFRGPVAEILAAARRGADLTGRMLAFARKQRVEPRRVNVSDVVLGIETMLARVIGEHIQIELRLASDLAPVLIDPSQLEQVLMNLAVNARDAMPAGGTLTIETGMTEISADEARRHPGLRPGSHVRLTVDDTGVGMDAATLARVFEPFFTTKESGKGTGLGLAMCYGIIKQANGSISCESTPRVGTTCTVLLPVAASEPERHA